MSGVACRIEMVVARHRPHGFQASLLDLRISKTLRLGNTGRVDLLFDVPNLLNDAAEEALASDNRFASTWAHQPSSWTRGVSCSAFG